MNPSIIYINGNTAKVMMAAVLPPIPVATMLSLLIELTMSAATINVITSFPSVSGISFYSIGK